MWERHGACACVCVRGLTRRSFDVRACGDVAALYPGPPRLTPHAAGSAAGGGAGPWSGGGAGREALPWAGPEWGRCADVGRDVCRALRL